MGKQAFWGSLTQNEEEHPSLPPSVPRLSIHPLCYVTHHHHGSGCPRVVFGATWADLPGFYIPTITEAPAWWRMHLWKKCQCCLLLDVLESVRSKVYCHSTTHNRNLRCQETMKILLTYLGVSWNMYLYLIKKVLVHKDTLSVRTDRLFIRCLFVAGGNAV